MKMAIQNFNKIINMFTCADDGALIFSSRRDLIVGSKIMCLVMAKWVLTLHVGHRDKKF